MKLRILWFFVITSVFILLISGCAQPNDPADDDEVNYLELVARYETDGYVVDMEFGEHHLYVAEDEGGFSIFDIESDTLCSRTQGYYSEELYYSLSNIKLLTADELSGKLLTYNKYGTNAGMHIFDISDPDSTYHIFNHIGNTGSVTDLTSTPMDTLQFQFYWANDYEYYSGKCNWSGLELWGISGEVAQNVGFDIAQMDEHYDTEIIYCASKQLGMKVLNKADFSTLGTVSTLGQTIAVKVVDNIAYLGNREEGIQVVDISDLDNQEILYEYDTTGLASDFAIDADKNVFALASTSGGVYLFNGPDGDFKRLQRIDDSEIGYTYVVRIHGNHLYVGTRYGIYKYLIVNV